MLERFLEQTSFESQEDFKKHLKIHVPDNFNFGYDIVDGQKRSRIKKPFAGQMIKVSIWILPLQI